jgi:hypothetical protein
LRHLGVDGRDAGLFGGDVKESPATGRESGGSPRRGRAILCRAWAGPRRKAVGWRLETVGWRSEGMDEASRVVLDPGEL